ncbi:hypothetical protein DYB25_006357, partial [Aphanomyces astaci]
PLVVEYTALQIRRLRAAFDRLATPYCRVVGLASQQLRQLFHDARQISHVKPTTPDTPIAPSSTLRSRRRKNLQPALLSPPPKTLHQHPSDMLLAEKIQLWWRVAYSVAAVCAG